MPRKPKPKPGDLIRVTWLDVVSETNGAAEAGDCTKYETVATFVKWRTGRHGRVFITCETKDADTGEPAGYTAYPAGIVVGVELVKEK